MDANDAEATNPVTSEGPFLQLSSVAVILRSKVRMGVAVIMYLPFWTTVKLAIYVLRVWYRLQNSFVIQRITHEIADRKEVVKNIASSCRVTVQKYVDAKRLILKNFLSKYYAIVKYYWQNITWRNFLRCIRILRVYDKLSFDYVDWTAYFNPDRRKPKFKEGHVCVRLRWRKGPAGSRSKRIDPWELHEKLMVTECFPVDSDGSLRIDQILKKWNIDELEFLIPGRWDLFTPSDPNHLSPLALYTLTQQHGYITVVEHEDKINFARKRFSYWYKSSFTGYLLRMSAFLLMVLLLSAVISYVSLNHEIWFFATFAIIPHLLFRSPKRLLCDYSVVSHEDLFF